MSKAQMPLGQVKPSAFGLPQLFKATLMAHRWVKKARQELQKTFGERIETALAGTIKAQNLILNSWQSSWTDRRPMVTFAKESRRNTWL
eukprot:Skav207198  [mRNA]  locus=scaffold4046:211489:211755:- [translate_table: standard]